MQTKYKKSIILGLLLKELHYVAHLQNIIILTGAGISAESGLATFRSSNGLWNNHKVEDVASIEGFERNPALVHDFYNKSENRNTTS